MTSNYSNDINKINEEYEDNIFRLAMNIVAEKEGELFLEEIEMLKSDPDYAPSEEATKRFKKKLNSQLRKNKKQNKVAYRSGLRSKVSVAAIIIIAVFSVSMLTVQAFRIQVLNFLINIEPKYTSIQLEESDDDQELIVNWTNAYVPTYVPEGFEVERVIYSESFNKITFCDSQNDEVSFVFTEYKSNDNIALDTENASIIKTIKINGNDGTFVEKDSLVIIGWEMDSHLFVVQGQISYEDALQIAENVEFIA